MIMPFLRQILCVILMLNKKWKQTNLSSHDLPPFVDSICSKSRIEICLQQIIIFYFDIFNKFIFDGLFSSCIPITQKIGYFLEWQLKKVFGVYVKVVFVIVKLIYEILMNRVLMSGMYYDETS